MTPYGSAFPFAFAFAFARACALAKSRYARLYPFRIERGPLSQSRFRLAIRHIYISLRPTAWLESQFVAFLSVGPRIPRIHQLFSAEMAAKIEASDEPGLSCPLFPLSLGFSRPPIILEPKENKGVVTFVINDFFPAHSKDADSFLSLPCVAAMQVRLLPHSQPMLP